MFSLQQVAGQVKGPLVWALALCAAPACNQSAPSEPAFEVFPLIGSYQVTLHPDPNNFTTVSCLHMLIDVTPEPGWEECWTGRRIAVRDPESGEVLLYSALDTATINRPGTLLYRFRAFSGTWREAQALWTGPCNPNDRRPRGACFPELGISRWTQVWRVATP